MGMMINRRRVCGGNSLPYDAEIEYLESSGTQYIDTGVIANGLDRIKCIAALEGRQTSHAFCGASNDSGRMATVWCTCGGACRFGGGGIIDTDLYWNLNYAWNDIELNYRGCLLNGHYNAATSMEPFDNTKSTQSIWLFKCNSFNSATIHIRFKEFKYYKNSNLYLDFIPVRVGTTGNMYDKVSGTLFGNAGTGDFILGPDK